ncbi:cytochrome c oxidase polypeptide IV, mitochondrial precursor, putative [Candida dubliniensis CD36]|uniref:Cytochrome c oxidase subunit 4, mitochondrial n=1 Tax=Candida dubliniensis (strain CD36 / ATCC MYA-646 / CBS 7987 / NCPF 3949 / NRRL Y-17841) TaxID=573826 RepID=B9WAK8_CANDC|nr:cytochrome c oxidase polypeptide IV, mitochondrial precursor, putative [Candida dubliniensis CD36]CAX43428.1 cytochrome c oxidase polypeptide IV, mitochondrial precursor, putative [Candida dubliniensis CD36]
MLSRTTFRIARQQTRLLSTSRVLLAAKTAPETAVKSAKDLSEVTGAASLIGPGAKEGTIPTDYEQATGLQRLELLGKREGVDVFDMEMPISEGKGTMQDPYLVPTYIGYRYVGCKGTPEQDHKPYWMKVEEGKVSRCWQCGTVLKAKYLGEPGMAHH